MPRKPVNSESPSTKVPRYRCHKASGQAVVSLSRVDHYLGVYGSKESREQYQQVVARWLAAGRRIPDAKPEAVVSLAEVLLAYLEHCQRKYASRRGFEKIIHRVKSAIRPARELYGLTPAVGFGPKALSVVRDKLIGEGLCRSTINDRVQIIKAAIAWAVAEELIPGGVWHAVSAVKNLRAGDSNAKEPTPDSPVNESFIDAVTPYLRPPVAAVVRLLLLTGARPDEICTMRTGDIDTSGRVWVYRPEKHKTDWKGKSREVFIGPAAQDVLRPWLRSNLAEHVFRPDEDDIIRRAALTEARKTPLSCGNKRGSNRKRRPRRKPRDRYAPDSIRRAVYRACDLADAAAKARAADDGREVPEGRLVPRWFPYQLRHNCATRARREAGIEAARVLLGHQVGNEAVTARYAEQDSTLAQAVALRIG